MLPLDQMFHTAMNDLRSLLPPLIPPVVVSPLFAAFYVMYTREWKHTADVKHTYTKKTTQLV